MSKTHNPYLRLFTRDIEGSPKVKSLSMEASGLYFRLLCRLTEPPVPGSIALHEWEQHHTWQRSLTQQCLATADKQERLTYFAKLLSKYFQWRTSDILKALRELYFFGIIVIEDDRLIQPRMYRDNGYKLADDPVDDACIDPATGAYISPDNDDMDDYKNHLKKNKKKNTQNSHARVHAHHALSNERENNINDSSKDSKEEKEKEKGNENETKTQMNVPAAHAAGAKEGFKSGEKTTTDNRPPDGAKTAQRPRNAATGGKKNASVADNPPSLEEIQAYFEERRQQGKPFIYVTAEGFYDACCESGWTLKNGKPIQDWRARCRTFESFRKDHGDNPVNMQRPVADPRQGEATPAPAPTKYKKW